MTPSRMVPEMSRHPHRASAWPACCFAGVAVPALQHGGGSKLKRLTQGTMSSHSHAADRHAILHKSMTRRAVCTHSHAAQRIVIRCAPRFAVAAAVRLRLSSQREDSR